LNKNETKRAAAISRLPPSRERRRERNKGKERERERERERIERLDCRKVALARAKQIAGGLLLPSFIPSSSRDKNGMKMQRRYKGKRERERERGDPREIETGR